MVKDSVKNDEYFVVYRRDIQMLFFMMMTCFLFIYLVLMMFVVYFRTMSGIDLCNDDVNK